MEGRSYVGCVLYSGGYFGNGRRYAHTLACQSWWRKAIKTRDVMRAEGNLISMDHHNPAQRPHTGAMDPADKHLETPLLHSSHISHRLGIDAYLKLEVTAVVYSKPVRRFSLVLEPPTISIIQVSGDIALHPTMQSEARRRPACNGSIWGKCRNCCRLCCQQTRHQVHRFYSQRRKPRHGQFSQAREIGGHCMGRLLSPGFKKS